MIPIALILAFIAGATTLRAQAPAPTDSVPAFEVASVKRNVSGSTQSSSGISPDGSVTLINQPLRSVIATAYGFGASLDTSQFLAGFKIVGGSEEILSARFDITAKAPEGTARRDAELMLRTLLAERFRLQVRQEARDTPVYAITMVREGTLGPNMRPSTYDCAAFVVADRRTREADTAARAICLVPVDMKQIRSGMMTRVWAGPIVQLVRQIQAYVDRPVIDATGLKGNFEWKITFAINPLKRQDIPSIFVALEEQLGLKLTARSALFDVFVIESVEPPSPD